MLCKKEDRLVLEQVFFFCIFGFAVILLIAGVVRFFKVLKYGYVGSTVYHHNLVTSLGMYRRRTNITAHFEPERISKFMVWVWISHPYPHSGIWYR